jgi:hypothetical protein
MTTADNRSYYRGLGFFLGQHSELTVVDDERQSHCWQANHYARFLILRAQAKATKPQPLRY